MLWMLAAVVAMVAGMLVAVVAGMLAVVAAVLAGIGQRTSLAAHVGLRRRGQAAPEAARRVGDAEKEDEGDDEGLHENGRGRNQKKDGIRRGTESEGA